MMQQNPDNHGLRALLRSLPTHIYSRAHDYAMAGHVGAITQRGHIYEAEVVGTESYETSVNAATGRGTCTCLAPKPCKHMGALAVVVLHMADGKAVATAVETRIRPQDCDLAVRIHDGRYVTFHAFTAEGAFIPLRQGNQAILKEHLRTAVRFSPARIGPQAIYLPTFLMSNFQKLQALANVRFYFEDISEPVPYGGTLDVQTDFREMEISSAQEHDPYALGFRRVYFRRECYVKLADSVQITHGIYPSEFYSLLVSQDKTAFYLIRTPNAVLNTPWKLALDQLSQQPENPLYAKWRHAFENMCSAGPRLLLSVKGVENEKTGKLMIDGLLEIAYARRESDFELNGKSEEAQGKRPLYCISVAEALTDLPNQKEIVEHKTGTLLHRDGRKEKALVKKAFFLKPTKAGRVRIAKSRYAEFFTVVIPRVKEAGILVRINDNIVGILSKPQAILAVKGSSGIDWFEAKIEVKGVAAENLGEIILAVRRKDELVKLKNGQWLSIQGSGLQDVIRSLERLGIRAKADGTIEKISFAELASLEAEKQIALRTEEGAAKAREKILALLNAPPPDERPPKNFKARLRPYQLTGMRFLLHLYRSQMGGILADDMGLGKTVQAIAAMAALPDAARFLVVCPVAALGVWEDEIRRFAPGLKSYRWHGPQRSAREADSAQVILTTFATFALDAEKLTAEDWAIAFIDEAQFVKNFRTKQARELRKLKAISIVCLTGTPLENYLEDLWALFDLAFPGYLGSAQRFKEFYGGHLDVRDAEGLQRKIRPFLLRRRKQDVLKELPEKTETVIKIPMTAEQAKVYKAARLRALEFLQQSGSPLFDMLKQLTALRRIACHPYLEAENPDPMHSGKFEYLESKLLELSIASEGVLVFSQYTSVLKVLYRMMVKRGIEPLYLDGQTSEKARRTLVARFQEGAAKFFLISLKAGGTALTLTRADTVIHLDPWWNPAVENQATDRAHRIGQKKRVMVYKLVSEGTVEEKVLTLQAHKRALFDEVVDKQAGKTRRITREDIQQLL